MIVCVYGLHYDTITKKTHFTGVTGICLCANQKIEYSIWNKILEMAGNNKSVGTIDEITNDVAELFDKMFGGP